MIVTRLKYKSKQVHETYVTVTCVDVEWYLMHSLVSTTIVVHEWLSTMQRVCEAANVINWCHVSVKMRGTSA
jgi:hypothetical protein